MTPHWQPTSPLSNLQLRARLLQAIRQFFAERQVLEVETPLLGHATATDPALTSFTTQLQLAGVTQATRLYLQTSPEFAMKRLLAAGSGSIYQICKAFRNGEIGKKHNPEFTLLEWYRVGFTHIDLMDEMDSLLAYLLQTEPADRISYLALFESYFDVNPHTCSSHELAKIASARGIHFARQEASRDIWLDLLLTHIIEPKLGLQRPLFIYDYPRSQAALAKIRQEDNYSVGERFEVYFKGMELANGYHELGDAQEQQLRFEQDNAQRRQLGAPIIPLDHFLLRALPFFPSCAGVALGLDRLICIAAGTESIATVMPFPIHSA